MARIASRIRALAGKLGRRLSPRPWIARDTAIEEDQPSLAIQPLHDLSPTGDYGHICRGLAVDLQRVLMRMPGLRVARAVQAVKPGGEDAVMLGRRRGVRSVLTGTLGPSPQGHTLLAMRLVDTIGGHTRWSARFAGVPDELPTAFMAIARGVARSLSTDPDSCEQVLGKLRGTAHGHAYAALLAGLDYARQPGRQRLLQAQRQFRRAKELDSQYARAWAELAACNARIYIYSIAQTELRREADEASRTALSLRPDLPESHVAAGLVHMMFDRWEQARGHFDQALALRPNHYPALYQYGRACMHEGEHARAAELYQRASDADPDEYQATLLAAQALDQLGQGDRALLFAREGLDRASRHARVFPDDGRAYSMGAGALLRIGDEAAARDWINRALALDPEDVAVHYNAACLYARLGESELALSCLERVELRQMANRGWVEHDPDLAALRDHPRFQRVLGGLRA